MFRLTLVWMMHALSPAHAQTDTITVKFNGFYEVVEGKGEQLTYSILLDSTYLPYEDMYLLRVMPLVVDEGATQKLEMGESYEVVIQRKYQHSMGCEGEQPIRIRSQRVMTDQGTLFGSNFLDRMISSFEGTDCRVRVVEYYTILEII